MSVRLAVKAGVAILGMVLVVLPVMACLRPGAAMTAAERECCKRMAEQCGHSGMAKSHGCCQTQVTPNDFNALKVSSSQIDHSLIELYAQPVAVPVVGSDQLTFSLSVPSPTHSPPGLLNSLITVLRI